MSLTPYEKRTRQRPSRGWDKRTWDLQSGQLSAVTIGSNPYNADNELIGFRNSEWKRQILNGENASTPMSAEFHQYRRLSPYNAAIVILSYGEPRYKQVDYYDNYLLFAPGKLPDNDFVSEVQSMADMKLLLTKLASGVEGLTILGELRETISLFRHPVKALRKGLDDYIVNAKKQRDRVARRRSRPGAKWKPRQKIWREVASGLWLEYAFGWSPTLRDIRETFDAILYRADAPENFKYSYRYRDMYMSNPTPYERGWGYIKAMLYEEHKFYVDVQHRGCAQGRCTAHTIPNALGLFPEEFIPTFWELCPWSFVIDYFSTIGDVLSAWAIAQRTSYIYNVRTTRKRTKSWIRQVAEPNLDHKYVGGFDHSPGMVYQSHKWVERAIRDPGVPYPSVQMKLNWRKTVNLSALMDEKARDMKFRPPRKH